MLRYPLSPKHLKEMSSEINNEIVIQDENGEVVGFKGNVARLKEAIKNQNAFREVEHTQIISKNAKRDFIENNPRERIERRASIGSKDYIKNYGSRNTMGNEEYSGRYEFINNFGKEDNNDGESSLETLEYASYMGSSDDYERSSSNGTSDYGEQCRTSRYNEIRPKSELPANNDNRDFLNKKLIPTRPETTKNYINKDEYETYSSSRSSDMDKNSSYSTLMSPNSYGSRSRSEKDSYDTPDYINKYRIRDNTDRTMQSRISSNRVTSRNMPTNRSRIGDHNRSNYDMKRSVSMGRQYAANEYRKHENLEDSSDTLKNVDRYESKGIHENRSYLQYNSPYIQSQERNNTYSNYKNTDLNQVGVKDLLNVLQYQNKDKSNENYKSDSYKSYVERNRSPSIRELCSKEELNIYRDRKGLSDMNHKGLRYDQRTTYTDNDIYVSQKADTFSKSNWDDCNQKYYNNNDVVKNYHEQVPQNQTGENDEEVVVTESWEEVYTVPFVVEADEINTTEHRGNDRLQEGTLAEILSEYQSKGVLPGRENKQFQYPIKRRGLFIENTIDTTSAPRTIDIVSDETTIVENNDNPYQNTFRISKENPLYTNNLDWQDTIGKNRFRKY